MTAPAFDAEFYAQQWSDDYHGRRRANEDGTRTAVCPDPSGHDRLERNPAQEWRPRSWVPAGNCKWCGGAL